MSQKTSNKSAMETNRPLNPDELRPILEDLLLYAAKYGAQHADAVATHGRSLSISVRGSKIEDIDSSEGRDIGLRVLLGQRQACVSSSDTSKDSLQNLAERAVAMAKLAPEDPYCGLADPKLQETAPDDLQLFDDTVIQAQDLQARALEIESAAGAVKGIAQTDGANAGATSSAIYFASSQGFSSGWRSSRHTLSVAAIAQSGGLMERDYDYCGARWLEDLRSAEVVGTTAGERAVARLNSRKMSSCRLPVIFDRRVSGSILATLIGAISGPQVSRGISFLLGKLGTQLFSDKVTITDNPLIKRGHGSRPWDGEGVCVKSRNIIDQGRLTTWLLNTSSARQLGLTTTGHAYRTIGSPPGVAATNFIMQPGEMSRDELLLKTKDALLVHDMFGPSINSNTGDYSVGVSGFKIEDGEIAYPVSEITIAGNLLDIYKNIQPANDLEMTAATIAPSLLLGEMTIAGQ